MWKLCFLPPVVFLMHLSSSVILPKTVLRVPRAVPGLVGRVPRALRRAVGTRRSRHTSYAGGWLCDVPVSVFEGQRVGHSSRYEALDLQSGADRSKCSLRWLFGFKRTSKW